MIKKEHDRFEADNRTERRKNEVNPSGAWRWVTPYV